MSGLNMEGYNDIPDWLGYCPRCPKCGGETGYSYLDSEFKCEDCDTVFDEQDFAELYNADYDDEQPFVCVTCGGPWPNCKTSCKLFDD